MRRTVLVLLATAAGLIGGAPAAGAAVTSSSSANWSGYVSTRAKGFRKVSATWTVPTVSCTAGSESYSAAWVGLGGSSTTSAALEQAGTEADCSTAGTASYTAWYELVPDVGHDLPLTVRPGDKIAASVTVSGHRVTVRMVDKTTGASVTKRLTAAAVDTTSAEWIVEAPSLCSGTSLTNAQCVQSSLANFGSTRFANARATSTYGHEGTVTDAAWSTTSLTLVPEATTEGGWDGPGGGRFVRESVSGAATPGVLNTSGDSFAVSWVDGSVNTPTTVASTRASTASAG